MNSQNAGSSRNTRRRWRGARRVRCHLFVEKAFKSELDAVGEQKIDNVYFFSRKISLAYFSRKLIVYIYTRLFVLFAASLASV
jgi:hypothetical protein